MSTHTLQKLISSSVTVAELRCVYDLNHMYALWILNTSESNPQSYEATKAVAKKAQKQI